MQRAKERRIRVAAVVGGATVLWTLTELALREDGTSSGPREGLALAVRAGVLVVAAGIVHGLRSAWHRWGRSLAVRLVETLAGLGARAMPWGRPTEPVTTPLDPGDRVALVAGLFVALLDVALTSLLLRDVFPEAPYRIPGLDGWSDHASDWSFYLAVAALKTVLALWLGLWHGSRPDRSPTLLWFVLGAASAFDAALAVARGMVLAEQGIAGASIMVSNIVFVGFGLAVPWVVAHTGRLLGRQLDPWLGALRWLPRVALLVLAGAAMLALLVPLGLFGCALGVVTAAWFAVEDIVGVLLGQEPEEPPLDDRWARIATIPAAAERSR